MHTTKGGVNKRRYMQDKHAAPSMKPITPTTTAHATNSFTVLQQASVSQECTGQALPAIFALLEHEVQSALKNGFQCSRRCVEHELKMKPARWIGNLKATERLGSSRA
jgi:hypothetical protein